MAPAKFAPGKTETPKERERKSVPKRSREKMMYIKYQRIKNIKMRLFHEIVK